MAPYPMDCLCATHVTTEIVSIPITCLQQHSAKTSATWFVKVGSALAQVSEIQVRNSNLIK